MKALRTMHGLRASLAAALGFTSVAAGTSGACGGSVSPRAVHDGGGADSTSGPAQAHPTCIDPVPIVVSGQDTGFDTCQGGIIRRRTVVVCPTAPLPPSTCVPDANPTFSQCASNGDCEGGPFGSCANVGYYSEICNCSYGCARDSDCAPNQICLCGDPVGKCVPASCNAGTCGAGLECAIYAQPSCQLPCNEAFACQTAADACFSPLDCGEAGAWVCSIAQGAAARACTSVQGGCCGFGRPFLVDHEPRVASLVERADWRTSVTPEVASLLPQVRARLAQHWTDAASMEHASVAAFARFVLQLLSLGAPADLVDEAQRAMHDETRHARLAFGMASAFAGKDIGPGPLEVHGSLEATDLRSFIETTFAEGCIGETMASLEAAEALEHLQNRDPAVSAVLATLVADEARHAELAWRSVAWALRTFGQQARDAIEDALQAALGDEASGGSAVSEQGTDPLGEALLERGVLVDGLRTRVRSEALRDVVIPLTAALLGEVRGLAGAGFSHHR